MHYTYNLNFRVSTTCVIALIKCIFHQISPDLFAILNDLYLSSIYNYDAQTTLQQFYNLCAFYNVYVVATKKIFCITVYDILIYLHSRRLYRAGIKLLSSW